MRGGQTAAVGVSSGSYITDFVITRPDLGGRVVKLARIEIPTAEVFARLPSVAGNPGLAIGTVLGIHRDSGGNVVSCGYMSPLSRYFAFNHQSEQVLTSPPTPL